MRRASSCLLLISAPFLLPAASDAMAAGAFRGRASHHTGAFHAPRSHAAVGRVVHRPAYDGRFAPRPYADRYGYHPYRNGSSFVGGGWPAVVDPAGETTVINQFEAPRARADEGGVPTAVGVRSPPVAAPVIYVIEPRRSPRRSIRIDRGVPGLSADAGDEILPRIVHLVPPR